MSCGKRYVRQTGRGLNDSLRECAYNTSSVISGHPGTHCRDSHCVLEFQRCEAVKRHLYQMTREILDALDIAMLVYVCVIRPLISLSLSLKKKRDCFSVPCCACVVRLTFCDFLAFFF